MTTETTHFRRPLWWFFLASLVLSAVVAYDMALPLGVGAVLGYITERRVDWALARIKLDNGPRWRGLLSAGFILLILLLVFLPVSIAVYVALNDLLKLIAHIDWNKATEKLETLGPVVVERLQSLGVETSFEQLRSKATELVTSNVGAAGGLVAATLTSTPNALFNALIIIIGWYVFAVEGKAGRDEVLPKLIPWDRPRQILRETTAEVIESVIIANILVSAVQAVICTIPLLVLRVPRSLVWSLLAFFLSFVPIVGTVPITFGAALWCYSQGRTGGAIVMVVVGIFVGSVDNVLRPLFMRSSKSAELSTLWLLVALTSGVSAFGLAGVIVGPLTFTLFVAFAHSLEAPPVTSAPLHPEPVPMPPDQPPTASAPVVVAVSVVASPTDPPLTVPPLTVPPLAGPPLAVSPVIVPPLAVSPDAVGPVAVPPLAVPPLAVTPVAVTPVAVPPIAVSANAGSLVAGSASAVPLVAVPPVAVPPVAVSPVAAKPRGEAPGPVSSDRQGSARMDAPESKPPTSRG